MVSSRFIPCCWALQTLNEERLSPFESPAPGDHFKPWGDFTTSKKGRFANQPSMKNQGPSSLCPLNAPCSLPVLWLVL